MVFVVGTILAVTSEALQPRKKQNAADKKMIDILSAIGVDATRSQEKKKYDKYIVDETIINNKGEIIDGLAFNIDVLFQFRDKTLTPDDFKYPFYTAEKIIKPILLFQWLELVFGASMGICCLGTRL